MNLSIAMDRLRERCNGWGGILAALGPASLFIALVVIPVWSNPVSSFGFEPDKSWLLMLLMAVGLGARLAGAPRPDVRLFRETLLAEPVLMILGAAGVCASLSTLFALEPTWSWFGSPQRAAGLLTLGAFLSVVWLARAWLSRPGGPELLSAIFALSSLPVLLIAVWQKAGWPLPAPWGGDGFAGRVFASLGNPNFLASYLVLLLPLTVAQLVGGRESAVGRLGLVGRFGFVLLAVLQVLALYGTRSRAGWLGGATALFCLGLCYGACRRWRARAVLAAALLLLLLNSVTPLMLITRTASEPEKGGWERTLDPTGSGRQRLMLWSGVFDYLASGRVPAGRWLLGFGPDAGGLVLPNQVAFRPRPAQDPLAAAPVFDRAHNVLLDTLLSGGALGLLAVLGLAGIASYAGLRRLGLAGSGRSFLQHVAAGVALGFCVTWLAAAWLGDVAMAAEASPAALGLGVTCGVIIHVGRRISSSNTGPMAFSPLFLAAAAGLLGHWVELQFSFETISAGLLASTYLAALLHRPTDAAPTRHLPAGAILSLLSGFALSACMLVAGLAGPPWPLFFLVTLWLASAALIAAWAGAQALSAYPLLSLGPAVSLGLAMRLVKVGPMQALSVVFVCWLLFLLGAGGIAWLLRGAERRGVAGGTPVRVAAGALLALVGLALAARLAAGDLLTQAGLRLAQAGQFEAAAIPLRAALTWGVHATPPYEALAYVHRVAAERALALLDRQRALAEAAAALRAGWDASPQQGEYGRRLALVYAEWAGAMPEPAGRRARLEEARSILELACQRAPADTRLRAELTRIRKRLAEIP